MERVRRLKVIKINVMHASSVNSTHVTYINVERNVHALRYVKCAV